MTNTTPTVQQMTDSLMEILLKQREQNYIHSYGRIEMSTLYAHGQLTQYHSHLAMRSSYVIYEETV